MSSSSSSSSGSGGWQSAVLYTGPAGRIRLRRNEVRHDELIEFFKGIDIAKEAITTIWAYKQNLGGWSDGKTIFAHFFLILKAKNWYWRIEKAKEGIFVESSDELKALLNPSSNPEIAEGQEEIGTTISTGTTILDLFQWIKDNNLLKKGYNVVKENCIHFAYNLYKWLRNNVPIELEKLVLLLRQVLPTVVPMAIGALSSPVAAASTMACQIS